MGVETDGDGRLGGVMGWISAVGLRGLIRQGASFGLLERRGPERGNRV